VAVTVAAAFTVTTQVPVPEHPPPDHPANVDDAFGFAVNVTTVPALNTTAHVAPQSTPAGTDVTVPTPAPARTTVNVCVTTLNVAVTVVAALSVTTQVPVPEHPPPLHPAKVEDPPGVAVSVTTVPDVKSAAQTVPQFTPAGADDTVPDPVPVRATVRVCGASANVAVTVAAAFIVTTHVLVPEHPAPDHPVNVDDAPGAAVSVTTVPDDSVALHAVPQLMPAGDDVTVPVPAPARLTDKANVNRSNCAVALTAVAPAGIVQAVEDELQAPVQATNRELAFGAAVSVTGASALNVALQLVPQLIPVGDEVTVPVPVPLRLTVTVRVVGSGATESPPEQAAMRRVRAIDRMRVVRSKGVLPGDG
jgi:hypothetical protein